MHDGTPSIHGAGAQRSYRRSCYCSGSDKDTGDLSGSWRQRRRLRGPHALLRTGRVLIFSGGWESSDLLHRSWRETHADAHP